MDPNCGLSALYLLVLFVCVCLVRSQPVCNGCLCDQQDIDRSTVKPSFAVRRITEADSILWELDMDITWQAPSETDHNYAVELTRYNGGSYRCLGNKSNQHFGPSFTLVCRIKSSQQHVIGELYSETDISFGYTYIFDVCLYNMTEDALARSSICVTNIVSPDCYEATKDEDFCRNQRTAVSGKPVNASLSRITPGIIKDGNRTVDVDVVWENPLQVNGVINRYTIETYNFFMMPAVREDQQTIFFEQGEGNTSRSHGVQISGLSLSTEYRTKITPWIVLPSNDVTGGLIAEVIFTTPTLSDLPTESPLMPTTDENANLTTMDQPDGTNAVTQPSGAPLDVLTISIVSTAVAIVFIVVLVFGAVRMRAAYCRKVIILDSSEMLKVPDAPARIIVDIDPIFKNKEVSHKDVEIGEQLGSGQFGVVYRGTLLRRTEPRRHVTVAVKTVKDDVSELMKSDFLNEIRLMIEIGQHQNVIEIIACCTVKYPYYMITELLEYGDLLHFLRKCNKPKHIEMENVYDISNLQRYQIARQIANGMVYISSRRFYHGDLAARNILVGSNLVVKISDFGLSSDVYEVGYQRLSPDRKRPVKWASLETNLEGKCTIQSDIWSYGVVLYEIFTNGDVPYKDIDRREVIRRVRDGYRMGKPENCPDNVYEKMLLCWHEMPVGRPSFEDLLNFFDDNISVANPADYLQINNEEDTKLGQTSHSFDTRPDGDVMDVGASGESVNMEGWKFERQPSSRTLTYSNDVALNYSRFDSQGQQYERYQDTDITE
ncbi:ephrin type-A receptor 3-like isoform X3 [Lytechinus variegatus]|uniref:ephrin type-A receptor 3-like isoform X3 n=1 Tax=Lytechinus variegatus TaxID=7654 RepID=UPI001BB14936|nr:ephrin type-A receptor 3-like isoform X3 [Lytechinus variegatus]